MHQHICCGIVGHVTAFGIFMPVVYQSLLFSLHIYTYAIVGIQQALALLIIQANKSII